jgi:hypothetical protein
VTKKGRRAHLQDWFGYLPKNRVGGGKLPFDLNGNRVFITALRLQEEFLFLASPQAHDQVPDW